MKMEQREFSETSAYNIQTPGITQKKAYKKIFLAALIGDPQAIWHIKWEHKMGATLISVSLWLGL